MSAIREKAAQFPTSAGVYLMKNARAKVVYVGKAKSLRARVRSYFNNGETVSVKTKHLMQQVQDIEYIITKTEVEAFLLEASLIKKHRPRYNIRLKDDKAYPYIRASLEHAFPRFTLVRRVSADGAMYFGPYASGLTVRETIRFLSKTYKIRDCTEGFFRNRKRPCISYQIGQCSAPCVQLIGGDAYRTDVQSALNFLKGSSAKTLKDLNERMKQAAHEERFEMAARLRDSLRAIEKIWDSQSVVTMTADRDQDVFAFFGDTRGTLIETLHVRGGRVLGSLPHFISGFDCTSVNEEVKEWLTSFINQYYSENIIPDEIVLQVELGQDIVKPLQAVLLERQNKKATIKPATGPEGKKLLDLALRNAESHFQDAVAKVDQQRKGLEEIQAKFGLPEPPRRIECFDISHFQGSENVASQVVFENGLPRKNDYRRYKIKSLAQGHSDDFAAMKEVLTRRFSHHEYEDPDLVVVDGGKGQLNVAIAVMKEIERPDLRLVGLAKARVLGEFEDAEVVSSAERFFLPGRQNPVTLPENSAAYQILVGIRDEAHRFAINYHRRLRDARSLSSVLDAVTGLGPKRKTTLLKAYVSVEAIGQATPEDLAALPGMNRVIAERILLQLKELASEEE